MHATHKLTQRLALALLLAPACGPVLAQEPAPPAQAEAPAGARAPQPAVGDATRQLLRLQRASAGAARPITGDVATLSYQRYLDSFKQPIPATTSARVGAGPGGK